MESGSDLFQSVETVLLKDLKRGDHIATKGELADLSPALREAEFIIGEKYYFHHGIYIGNNEVIDFGGRDKSSAKPRKVDLLEFMESSCDRKLYRIRYKPGVCLPVEETVKMAEDAVAHTSRWPMYHVIKNNCETFATYMKTKIKASSQAVKALVLLCTNPMILLRASSVAVGGSLGSGSGGSGSGGRQSGGSGSR